MPLHSVLHSQSRTRHHCTTRAWSPKWVALLNTMRQRNDHASTLYEDASARYLLTQRPAHVGPYPHLNKIVPRALTSQRPPLCQLLSGSLTHGLVLRLQQVEKSLLLPGRAWRARQEKSLVEELKEMLERQTDEAGRHVQGPTQERRNVLGSNASLENHIQRTRQQRIDALKPRWPSRALTTIAGKDQIRTTETLQWRNCPECSSCVAIWDALRLSRLSSLPTAERALKRGSGDPPAKEDRQTPGRQVTRQLVASASIPRPSQKGANTNLG